MSRGNIWRLIGLVTFGVVLGWLGVELLLRLVPGLLPPQIQPQVTHKSWLLVPVGPAQFVTEYRLLWEQDEFLRERMKPDLDTTVHGNPEYPAWPIQTDSLGLGRIGFRDNLPDRPPYALVLGDSFGFGVGVEQAQIWSEQLERETGLPFVNLSQVGASSLQEARIYAQYGRRLQAKVVFWLFFQNDLKDNLRFAHWLDPEANITQAIRAPRQSCAGLPFRALKQVSMAYELVIYWRRLCDYSAIPPTPIYRDGSLDLTFCLDHDICDLDVQAQMQSAGWPLTHEALRQTKAQVRRSGAELVIIIVPSKEQVYWQQFQQVADLPPDYDVDQLISPLLEFCARAREQLHCIDLTGAFRAQAGQGAQLYFPVDIHWNAEGHRLVAEVVGNYLREANLLP